MAKIKSYTDLEQSKKLAEFLPLESADMCWVSCDNGNEKYFRAENRRIILNYEKKHWIPCWSLAALLDIIPQEIFDGEYIINITEGWDVKWALTYDHCKNKNHSFYGLSSNADNLVDVCYELILKLYERKML